MSRSSCLNYLHRLGFVLRRLKRRLLKAGETKREAFVAEYAVLSNEARRSGAKDILCRRGPFPWGRRVARQMGPEGRGGTGGVHQPTVWGEGQLLLGGVPGDRAGGVDGLASRKDEVQRRCRTVLQSRAATLLPATRPDSRHSPNAHPTLALQPVTEVRAHNDNRNKWRLVACNVTYDSCVTQL